MTELPYRNETDYENCADDEYDPDEELADIAADGVTATYLRMRRDEIGNGGPQDF